MNRFPAKQIGIIVLALIILGLGTFAVLHQIHKIPVVTIPSVGEPASSDTLPVVIGTSVEGRSIESYTYGKGGTHLMFVGGIHGGYEWNSVALAYAVIDALESGSLVVSDDLMITIVPSLNPDGLYKGIGIEGRFDPTTIALSREETIPGRFNAHGVDLNRNFDCKWKPTSTWRSQIVSAGTQPFSEPEAQALRNFVYNHKPRAVVFWHSQANAVYASECEAGILPETRAIMNQYANASGYPAVDSFDAYPISGDAEGWLASISIPAITVELKTHETLEWERNLAGIKALFEYYGNNKKTSE